MIREKVKHEMYWSLVTMVTTAESAFDISGRPLEPAFYTGIPSYHNIIYDIYEMRQSLDNQREEDIIEVSDKKNEPVKFWVKKKAMANILAAEISDDQVEIFCIIMTTYDIIII